MIERKTITAKFEDLPFEQADNRFLIDYSMLVLIVPWRSKPYDIGVLCYSKRKLKYANANHKHGNIWLVDKSSLIKSRAKRVSRFLEYLYYRYKTGTRSTTLYREVSNFVMFLDWCDTNENSQVLNNIKEARKSYTNYTAFLMEHVRTSTLNINTASRYQKSVKVSLIEIFEDEKRFISTGVMEFQRSTAASSPTTPPSRENVKKTVDLYLALFHGITDFILKYEKYPFQLSLPEETLWVFPSSRPMAGYSQRLQRDNWTSGHWAWDYDNGLINHVDQIETRYKGDEKNQRECARATIKSAYKTLNESNNDPHVMCRRRLASFASGSFIMLFISNTAMNLAQVIDLPWSKDFKIESAAHGYKAIKYRAQRKDQMFVVTSSFIRLFNKYLELRRYLLNDEEYPHLFFGLDISFKNPVKLKKDFTYSYYNKISNNIAVGMPKITPREWRAYKADWLMRNTDISTTASLLQNTESTILNHYIAGSETESSKELATFFDFMNKRIVMRQDLAPEFTDTPSGQCESYNNPTVYDPDSHTKADCAVYAGCLMCENFRVIADENDIRKLLSLQYLISESRYLAQDLEQHELVYSRINSSINEIILAISEKGSRLAKLVDRVRVEVFENEILYPYWARKYEQLIELELL